MSEEQQQPHQVPTSELDHLDKMAESHANNPMVAAINQQVASLLPQSLPNEAKILDFGCGAGRISLLLAKRDNVASVVGTDISQGMIVNANRLLGEENQQVRSKVSFQTVSRLPTTELAPWKGTKDLVVMSLVLGHVTPKAAGQQVVEAAASTLKPGGAFALAEFLFVEGQEEEGHVHGHSHDHSHGHHHHHHHNHHDHEKDSNKENSHHGGHVAYSEVEIRQLFGSCGLKPAEEFTPFQFEWGGTVKKCIMAIGTKS